MAAPLRPVIIEWQVGHHFFVVMLRSIVRVVYWMVGEMSSQGLVAVIVIKVGRILDWVIFHAVALRVANRLCTSSSTW